jgi:hypothetical protein
VVERIGGGRRPAILTALLLAPLVGLPVVESPPGNAPQSPAAGVVQWWSSSESLETRLTPQPGLRFTPIERPAEGAIVVDDGTTYQRVLGLGSSLEHSTCYNLSLLPPDQRERVMESLVHPVKGIGMSLMRLCIGTSDFAPGPFYTYDDMPPGEEDLRLERFSIERDREYVLPIIKAAQRLNPRMRFVAGAAEHERQPGAVRRPRTVVRR